MYRFLFVALSVLTLSLALTAEDKKDEKIDPKLLVGKWANKDTAAGTWTVEFTKDGKVAITVKQGDKDATVEGTYKADGTKLTMTMLREGKEEKWERTITKLTDTELTSKDEKGAERRFERTKDKK